MGKDNFYKKLTSGIFYFSILIFIIAFNFSDNGTGGGGWQLQRLPNLNGSQIIDMTFTDSLTGYAKTNADADSITKILKTTDGGDNWYIIKNEPGTYTNYSFQFLNSNTGFCGFNYYGPATSALYKTTNGGISWDSLNTPLMFWEFEGISVVSDQEIWTTDYNFFVGGVFRTTNSGISWERKFPPFANGKDRMKIYMINSRIGFFTDGYNINSSLRKTTDAGLNWQTLPNAYGWYDIYFKDSLNGWKSTFNIANLTKTTDGGLTWDTLLTTQSGNPNRGITNFKIINENLIWGVNFDSYILFPNSEYRGVIFKTTNGGINWGYQLPDTSTGNVIYNFIDFTDSLRGWCYSFSEIGVHTTLGGDTTFYTGIQRSVGVIPEDFVLKQNYPNPFNPRTVIPFSLKRNAFVKLVAYDIRGVEVQRLVDGRYNAGDYEVDFMGKFSPSGVYFYKIEITTDNSNEVYVDTKRMILLK